MIPILARSSSLTSSYYDSSNPQRLWPRRVLIAPHLSGKRTGMEEPRHSTGSFSCLQQWGTRYFVQRKWLFLPPYPRGVVVSVYQDTAAEQLLLDNPHVQFHVPTASKLFRWICKPNLKSSIVAGSATSSENALYYLNKCWMLCWYIHIHFFILSFWNSKHTLSLQVKVFLSSNANLPWPKEKNTRVTEGKGQKKSTRKEWTAHHHVNYGNEYQIFWCFLCETEETPCRIKLVLFQWYQQNLINSNTILPTSSDNIK